MRWQLYFLIRLAHVRAEGKDIAAADTHMSAAEELARYSGLLNIQVIPITE